MRLPKDVLTRLKEGAHLGIEFDDDGYARGFQPLGDYSWGVLYPPLGYLKWEVLEVGNGDSYGYYWPIGRENRDPIVCTASYDGWTLWPVATSLERCLRVLLVREPYLLPMIEEVADDFGYDLSDVEIADEEDGDPHEWPDALPQDPNSPGLLLDRAEKLLRGNDLAGAQDLLVRALQVLPEYTEASFLLARIHRRQRDPEAARAALLATLTSPQAFCEAVNFTRETALSWFRRLRGGDLDGGDGVLWRERQRLTAGNDPMRADEYAIYEEAISAYHAAGQGATGVRLRILTGELLDFRRAKFEWSREAHAEKLRADLEKAGLGLRAHALDTSDSRIAM